MPRPSPLGATFWNTREDELVTWGMEVVNGLQDRILVDGYAPGTERADPRTEYETLVEMQASQNPAFTDSPEAQRRLVQLSQKFGQPPIVPGPMPPQQSLLDQLPGGM